MDPFIGQLLLFGGNFTINGWAMCQGQLLPISQNTALFSLLGTTYGGNGTTTFGLPDLRGRAPIGMGQGPGLSNIVWGQMGGAETLTILQNNLPAHVHTVALPSSTDAGNTSVPTGAVPANSGALDKEYATGTGNSTMATVNTNSAGGNLPVSIRDPYLGMNYLIALVGIYPSRN